MTETLEPGTSLERVYSYTYDAIGNKESRTFPDGTVTNYTYNAVNKLVLEDYVGATTQNRSYEYNLAGTVTKATDITGITQYNYDVLGRITAEIKKTLGGVEVSTITSAYDKAGNRVSVSYPDGRTLYSTYDKRNALKTIVDNGETTVYTYDANGNRLSLMLPNGVNTATLFDAGNRVTSITETSSTGTQLYRSLYYYDKTAARVKITESRNGAVVRDSIYTYDQTDKLLSESDGTTTIVYTYDDADNRISKTVNGVTTTYAIDKLNRVLSATTGGVINATFTYDLNGNRQTKTVGSVTHNYLYDRENRLTSVSTGGADIFNATYDYRTRRMTRLENNTLTQYVYDGGECAQERDSAGSLTKTFIRGSGLGGGIGSILYSETPSSTREYLLYNVIGSVVVTCNQAGNSVSTSLYEAFGKVIASTGSSDNHRLFCTKERSESIGLDNFGFRYFDWEIGRFIQRDPSGYPDGLNNYLYCSNNPINRIDPLGLEEKKKVDEEKGKKSEISIVDTVKGMFDFKNNLKKSAANTLKPFIEEGAKPVGVIGEKVNEIDNKIGLSPMLDTAAMTTQGTPTPVDDLAVAGGMGAMKALRGISTVAKGMDKLADILGGWQKIGKTTDKVLDGLKTDQKLLPAAKEQKLLTEGTSALQKFYPGNSGFLGKTENKFLMPGEEIDRFGGSSYSRFFAPTGTPEAARALPPGTANQALRTFQVRKPFEVKSGTVAPAFGQTGLGQQYKTPVILDTLIKKGIVEEQKK